MRHEAPDFARGTVVRLACEGVDSIGLTGINLAKAIDDNGDIVGNGDDSAGNTHAFLLTPQVPEPGWLGIVGLVGFMAMAKRRRRVQLV